MEHFILAAQGRDLGQATRPSGGPSKSTSRTNPAAHGQRFVDQLSRITDTNPLPKLIQQKYYDGARGRLLHFDLDYGISGAKIGGDDFGGGRKGIEFVRYEHLQDECYRITLYVPFEATSYLINQVKKYVDSSGGKAKRWASIYSIEEATVKSIYHDEPDYFPDDLASERWFELWLVKKRSGRLVELCEHFGIELDSAKLEFHDRLVVLARLSPKQLVESYLINLVAEVCMPTFSISRLHALPSSEQSELLQSVNERLLIPNRSIRVAIFDSGVTTGHPLLRSVVNLEDTYDYFGGDGDDIGDHGTGIASLVLYGERIEGMIAGADLVRPAARLESVRLLKVQPDVGSGDPDTDAKLFGCRTAEACYLFPPVAEGEQRIYLSTITDSRRSRSGAPDSYSAALDSLSYGRSPLADITDPHGPKLIIQSAGNSQPGEDLQHLERPAQAWNVLTVGACTKRPAPPRNGRDYFAEHGSLSPSTSHGLGYESKRALKPDLVMEGGNAERDEYGSPIKSPDCMVLGASSQFPIQHFSLLDGTSSAAALAGNLAAKVWSKYPTLRPNSVRALLVNSANWSDSMLAQYKPTKGKPSERMEALVQRCGMGIPNPYFATESEQHFITLVFEEQITPFVPGGSDRAQNFNEFQLIELPWPTDELLSFGSNIAHMRVTLSSFIDPNPTNKDYASRYAYESHGLRFKFKRHNENSNDFEARVSKEHETEDNLLRKAEGKSLRRKTTTSKWSLGGDLRTRGSIGSDCWKGRADHLATMDQVAIVPVSGWWRHSRDGGRHSIPVDYSLAISITLRDHEDSRLYHAVQQIVKDRQMSRVSIDA